MYMKRILFLLLAVGIFAILLGAMLLESGGDKPTAPEAPPVPVDPPIVVEPAAQPTDPLHPQKQRLWQAEQRLAELKEELQAAQLAEDTGKIAVINKKIEFRQRQVTLQTEQLEKKRNVLKVKQQEFDATATLEFQELAQKAIALERGDEQSALLSRMYMLLKSGAVSPNVEVLNPKRGITAPFSKIVIDESWQSRKDFMDLLISLHADFNPGSIFLWVLYA